MMGGTMFCSCFSSMGRRAAFGFWLLFVMLAAPLAVQASVFTGGSSNVFGPTDPRNNLDWQNEFNWEPVGIPSSEAVIPAGMTVDLRESVSIQTLTVAGVIRGTDSVANLTVTGSCDWSGGQVGGSNFGQFNIAAGASLNLTGSGQKWLLGNLNNAGTINWSGSGTLRTGYTVTNTGTINITADTGYFGETGNGGVFNNSGTVVRSAGTGIFYFAGFDGDYHEVALNNTGSVQVQTGTVQMKQGRSTGTFSVSSGATLLCQGLHEFDGAALNGAGDVVMSHVGGNATTTYFRGNIVRTGGPLKIDGSSLVGGFQSDSSSAATLSGNGKIQWLWGNLSGNWTIGSGCRIEASGNASKGIFTAPLTNRGTIDWLGGAAFNTGSLFINEGTFNVNAAGTFWEGVGPNYVYFENRGTLNTFADANSMLLRVTNSGTLNVGVGGAGTLSGISDLYNSGTVNLGAGDYLQVGYLEATTTSKFNIDIGGTATTQFGRAYVGGNPALAGQLNARFVDGFAPQMSDTFRVITKIGQVSTFGQVTAQNLTAKTVVANYIHEAVDLGLQPLTVSVNDVTVTEGNSGSVNANFKVTLSAATDQTVSVQVATANGTSNPAMAGSDYAAQSSTVTFAPGETQKTISVAVNGDTIDEANETFFVNLSNASGAVIADGQGLGTINDNDVLPQATLSGASVISEGNGGADFPKALVFTVSLNTASGRSLSVNYAVAPGATNPATAPGFATSDFLAQSDSDGGTPGKLTIPAGALSGTITVPIVGDTRDELDETLKITLSGASNVALVSSTLTTTITDDDATPGISVLTPAEKPEGNNGTVTTNKIVFAVRLGAVSGRTVTVNYALSPGTGNAATAGVDYLDATDSDGGTPGVLTIPAGQSGGSITIPLVGDLLDEFNETVKVTLSAPTNAVLAISTAQGGIQDDDATPTIRAAGNVSVIEGNGGTASPTNMVFTVNLSAASGRAVSVKYAVAPGSTNPATRPGFSGADYMAQSDSDGGTAGTLNIPAGATFGTITVPIMGDTSIEANETLTLTLSNAVNATLGTATATGTIQDDDGAGGLFAALQSEAASGPVIYANRSASSIEVVFADADAAQAAGGFSVKVDGQSVSVQSTVREGSQVVLLLPEGSLPAGAAVSVAWNGGTAQATAE